MGRQLFRANASYDLAKNGGGEQAPCLLLLSSRQFKSVICEDCCEEPLTIRIAIVCCMLPLTQAANNQAPCLAPKN